MKKQENVSLDIDRVRAERSAMTMAETMHAKLVAAFAPTELEVVDESARHEGHAGSRPGGETHFHVRIVSSAFEGATRIERQRRVYAALAEELKARVHALSLTVLTPAESWSEH
ncbi:MAG TPA: BolA family protein [Rhizomicrobium sp.]|nr:BolA family protein [Rhizomicrobium sp.]